MTGHVFLQCLKASLSGSHQGPRAEAQECPGGGERRAEFAEGLGSEFAPVGTIKCFDWDLERSHETLESGFSPLFQDRGIEMKKKCEDAVLYESSKFLDCI